MEAKEEILNRQVNFPCKITETQEEICVTRTSALLAMQEYLEQEYPGYCPECDACGEEGCCSPLRCKRIKCEYGERYVEDYNFAIDFANRSWELFKDDQRLNDLHSELYDKHYKK